jgi:hypothetical protein
VALGCLWVLRSAGAREAASRVALWPAALVVAASLGLGPTCAWESGLSCLDVDRQGGAVHLYSDRTRQAGERTGAIGEVERLALPYTRWIWSRLDRDLGPAPTVLFVGGGGYSLPARLLEARPGARAVVVEIDPLVTEVVRAELPWAGGWLEREGFELAVGWPPDGRRMAVVHADGRAFLRETGLRFDAVVMDAFSSGAVPAHLVTLETYARLREIVDGPVYVNLLDRPDGRLAQGAHAVLAELWPHVEVVSGPIGQGGLANVVLAASPGPLGAPEAMPSGFARATVTPARPFTDDRGWIGHR